MNLATQELGAKTNAPAPLKYPVQVTYRATDMVISVLATDEHQRAAITRFAEENGFPTPAPADARPVYFCNCRTFPDGYVGWA